MRFSKSTSRGLMKTGCVCESTKPGRTTFPAQSISVTFLRFFFSHGSRSASLVVPTETIFPPRHRTAPSSMMPSSLRSEPRRGPGLLEAQRSVTNWPMFAKNSDDSLRTQPPQPKHPPRRHRDTEDSWHHRTRHMITRWRTDTLKLVRRPTRLPVRLRQKSRRTPCLRVSVVRVHFFPIGTFTPVFSA